MHQRQTRPFGSRKGKGGRRSMWEACVGHNSLRYLQRILDSASCDNVRIKPRLDSQERIDKGFYDWFIVRVQYPLGIKNMTRFTQHTRFTQRVNFCDFASGALCLLQRDYLGDLIRVFWENLPICSFEEWCKFQNCISFRFFANRLFLNSSQNFFALKQFK